MLLFLSHLEERSDVEDNSQFVNENVSGSDRSTHHTEHNTDIEPSADNDDPYNEEPSPIDLPSAIPPIRGQCTSNSS